MLVGLMALLGIFVGAARADDAAKTCFPDCSPGYLCNPNTGSCVEACNPPCAAGTRCTPERVCVSTAAPAATPPASAPVGTGNVCVKRKFNAMGSTIKWTIELDGETVGTVGAGSEQCFASPSGSHKLGLTFNIPSTGAKVEAAKTIEVAATQTLSIEAKLSGLNAANIVFE